MFRLKVRLVPEGRRVCEKGHLTKKTQSKFCQVCWKKTPKGCANQFRYNHSAIKHASNARYYYKRRALGFSAAEACRRIVPGDEAETQRRLERTKERYRIDMKKYRECWGYPDHNFAHHHRQQMIRSGEWKAEEHPL